MYVVCPSDWPTSTEKYILIMIMCVYIVQGVRPKDKRKKAKGRRPKVKDPRTIKWAHGLAHEA
ncbi:unnamed protein product [Prunus armeniaca]